MGGSSEYLGESARLPFLLEDPSLNLSCSISLSGCAIPEAMAATSSAEAFELVVAVLPTDIDELGHVNNTVYLRWVQEAATAHWQATTSTDDQAGIGWVVMRHEIDYKAPAFAGDEVLLRTWVGKASRLTFERHTEVRRARDRQLLAQARTLWCPISSATGRPTRVPAEVRDRFSA